MGDTALSARKYFKPIRPLASGDAGGMSLKCLSEILSRSLSHSILQSLPFPNRRSAGRSLAAGREDAQ